MHLSSLKLKWNIWLFQIVSRYYKDDKGSSNNIFCNTRLFLMHPYRVDSICLVAAKQAIGANLAATRKVSRHRAAEPCNLMGRRVCYIYGNVILK